MFTKILLSALSAFIMISPCLEARELLEVAKIAALRAGEIARRGYNTSFKITHKPGSKNLVTSYDLECEKCIMREIKLHFPDHVFLSEESGEIGQDENMVQWIIDPIDGTANFACSIPQFTVSIAAVYRGEVLVGVVYAPMQDELFCAAKLGGATLNGKRIKIGTQNNLLESMLATGMPYNAAQNPKHCINRLNAIAKLGMPFRSLGSAALELAYVACGRFDGFWEMSLQAWDYAAAKLIIEEAGGKITDVDGKPIIPFQESSIVAGNASLHAQLIRALCVEK